MAPAPEPLPPPRFPVFPLFALPIGLLAWYLLREGNAIAHTIEWWCDSEGCSTSDPRILLIGLGAFADLWVFLALMSVLRLVAFGAALALAPLAAMSGWNKAIAGGMPAGEVATEFKVWGTVAGVGIALALLGVLVELRSTATLQLLIGRERSPAALQDYREGAKPGFGSAALVFRDQSGHPHRKQLPEVPGAWKGTRLFAVYPPHDPSRARLALPWYRPWKQHQGEETSAPEADRGAKPSLTGELERLAALRREGLLTEAEFDQAKRRLLG